VASSCLTPKRHGGPCGKQELDYYNFFIIMSAVLELSLASRDLEGARRLLTPLIGFRLTDPIRGDIDGVLSEKEIQLGRMFLYVAHGVQQKL